MTVAFGPGDRADIEDQANSDSDYVLPEDIQDMADDTAELEQALSDMREEVWGDD